MRTGKIILASLSATTILMSAAFADDTTGMITRIDRLNGTIEIQPVQDGTVGSNSSGAQRFKAQDGAMLESVHAGDRVTYSASDKDGVKTITKLQRK
jgi:Cu/Ag efflux protein CusF